jgi:23S rRNA (adenine2503-C2)-methyltransferase
LSDPWSAPTPDLEAPARPNAAGMSRIELGRLVHDLGERPFRAAQLFEGLYQHRWTEWERFTALSRTLRERLLAEVDLDWPAISESRPAGDGTTKHAFRLRDGRQVEGVFMPYADRTTLCLSSQVGCAMGCTFCATGSMGLLRNLLPGEILGQVMAMLIHHGHQVGRPLNLVFMGMGEPLHNLDHVMTAFEVLTDPLGLAIPPRRITLSTCGLVPGIDRLGAHARRPRLALSLNATTDLERSRIMPVNRAWGLEALGAALARFPLASQERITLEYVLLRGVTDRPEDARRLAAFASRFPAKVNLIPFNAHLGSGFQPPSETTIETFCQVLSKAGLPVSVRRSRGQAVGGACGQLVREGRPRG